MFCFLFQIKFKQINKTPKREKRLQLQLHIKQKLIAYTEEVTFFFFILFCVCFKFVILLARLIVSVLVYILNGAIFLKNNKKSRRNKTYLKKKTIVKKYSRIGEAEPAIFASSIFANSTTNTAKPTILQTNPHTHHRHDHH